MECTGFGLNLVSGNYEFASVIIIDDEEFWLRFGGHIEANWESNCLRQYSSMDRGRPANYARAARRGALSDRSHNKEVVASPLALQKSKWRLFENSAHMPHIEESPAYLEELDLFLSKDD